MKLSKKPKLNWYYFQEMRPNDPFIRCEILEDYYGVGFTPQLALQAILEKLKNQYNYNDVKINESFYKNIILVTFKYSHSGNDHRYRWAQLK